MKKIILLNILFLNQIYSQQTPAPDQDKSVLIFGAVAHIGNGETIKKGGYEHEISYIAGLFQEKKVSGKREMDDSKALEKAAQQLALKFLNDYKDS